MMKLHFRPRPATVREIMRAGLLATLFLLTMFGICEPTYAEHPCTSPLILDLGNDGVNTTSLNHPVRFDINGDGETDTIAWTAWYFPEAFLWLDQNHNRRVDDGTELFGNNTLMADGGFASNGFEALAVYDREELGGNGDGAITADDLVWPHLLLWIDENHNGVSEPTEISPLPRHGVAGIGLAYSEHDERDGNTNLHRFQGTFLKYVRGEGRPFLREQAIHDVFFAVADHDE